MSGDPFCYIHGFNPCSCHERPFPWLEEFSGKETPCQYCGFIHATTCPRIKAIEYHENGLIKRIEFHEEGIWKMIVK